MGSSMDSDELVFNGLDGSSGAYLAGKLSLAGLRERAFQLQKNKVNFWGTDDHLDGLKIRSDQGEPAFDLRRDSDPRDLSDAGWGLVFPELAASKQVEQIQAALTDLISLRRQQAGNRFKIFYGGGNGYLPGETGEQFASRHGIQPGSVDPRVMPYYLLIVADPSSIPFSFQYQLDVQFAVGRIYFDRLEEYAQYARSVWTTEQDPTQIRLKRQVVFFSVENQDDPSTRLSARRLIAPLYAYASSAGEKPRAKLGWQAGIVPSGQATKASLLEHLGGPQTPALFFTASHGLGWPCGDPRQVSFQGALVCADWPGPIEWRCELRRDFYLGAEDIDSGARLLGSMAFFFACYGAGTPLWEDYAMARNQERKTLAARPFLAALPLRLLSHPRGGLLAVVGHVERAWGYSFDWRGQDAEPQSFKDFLYELMRGMPVGYAMESLNTRYGQIAALLSAELDELKHNRNRDAYAISRLWMANNDSRSYAILGDPAARLPLAARDSEESARPSLTVPVYPVGDLPTV